MKRKVHGNWFLPHLNFRHVSVERNIIHAAFTALLVPFSMRTHTSVNFNISGAMVFSSLKWVCSLVWMACDRTMHQVQHSNCDGIVVCHNNLYAINFIADDGNPHFLKFSRCVCARRVSFCLLFRLSINLALYLPGNRIYFEIYWFLSRSTQPKALAL